MRADVGPGVVDRGDLLGERAPAARCVDRDDRAALGALPPRRSSTTP
jgi:hypothetical protein